MKKLLLIFMLLLVSISTSGRELFSLSENGLIISADPEARFIVIEMPDKTQQELFNSTKRFLHNKFVSPKDVLSEVDNTMITLNGISEKAARAKQGFGYVDISINYTMSFYFKNNKIRVDIPTLNSMTGESYTLGGDLGSLYELILTKDQASMMNRTRIVVFDKGKVKNTTAKESIEKFLNGFIDDLITHINGSKDSDW